MKNLTLEAFLDEPPPLRNSWLKEPGLEVHVRLTERLVCGERVETLDIASVSAGRQGSGYFTAFLAKAEKEARERKLTIFIENVISKRFSDFFFKRGYCEVRSDPQCFALFLAYNQE